MTSLSIAGASHRTRIVELFEKHRATPGAPYDEQHFLDFLLAGPEGSRSVYNSFRGLRRFNAFINDVQLEFAICFSLKDREANYSLSKFADRVVELEQSRRGSLASLKNQAKAGPGWHVVVLANLILVILGASLRERLWVIAILAVLAVSLTTAFVGFARKDKIYLERLRARIEADKARS